MSFKDLKKGDPLCICMLRQGNKTCDIEVIKSIRRKYKKIQILTDDEYWFIPDEYVEDVTHTIIQGDIRIILCSDQAYFKEIYEND